MKNVFAALLIITVVLFAACAKKNTATKTAAEMPKEKSTVYATDVMAVMQAKCTPCHFPSKNGSKASFENYESAKKFGPEMLAKVQLNPGERGFMPFKGTKLSAEEIAVFKKWVDGGMQEK